MHRIIASTQIGIETYISDQEGKQYPEDL